MEPICWAGLVGVIAIAAAIGGLLKGSCKHSSCDCDTKKESGVVNESPVAKDSTSVKESTSPVTGIDAKKEKAINDLIK
jgi:hypothetical protein